MNNCIEIEGFEELEQMIQNMTIKESDEKEAMRKAIEPIYTEVEKNTPESSDKLKKSLKKMVKKDGLATVGIVSFGRFYDIFNEFEYGNSRNKKHVGFFARSINKSKNEAISILAKELLDKAK